MSIIRTTASINATGAPRAVASKPAHLDAEKANCERQLADWVHCVSASTPEGKAKIEALTDQLSAIKASMNKADDARAESDQQLAPQPTPTLGNQIDVYA